MTRYAAETHVSTDQSKAEIERILVRYGADQFAYASTSGQAMIGFRKPGVFPRVERRYWQGRSHEN